MEQWQLVSKRLMEKHIRLIEAVCGLDNKNILETMKKSL